ncbi:rRNA maturation RNase YbeY [Desulfobacterales bacterium HSG17]|nr:rRNA maturation RNase YbeY [Desulfobacterales bacterium HSG17]
MAILIQNNQKNVLIKEAILRRKAHATLGALASPDAELSIVIVDDPNISDLNETFLGHQGPTNVISFPMQEGEFAGINPNILGDVVISADTALREAENAEISFDERLDQLLIHGILHLFGFDHIDNMEQEARMEKKSQELLELTARIA